VPAHEKYSLVFMWAGILLSSSEIASIDYSHYNYAPLMAAAIARRLQNQPRVTSSLDDPASRALGADG
jgi:hypothetical protein